MNREFVYVPHFDKKWNNLNLDNEDLRLLENYIMENPVPPVLCRVQAVFENSDGRFHIPARVVAYGFCTLTLLI